jgi:hypothetical protein
MSDRQRVQQTLCPLLRPAAPLSVGAALRAPPEASSAAARPLGGGAMVAAVQLLGSVAATRTRPPRSPAQAGVSRVQVVHIELSVVPCGQLHAIIEPNYVIIPAKTPGRPKIPWASEVGREIRNKNPAR